MSAVDHPFRVDGSGRTGRTDDAGHVRDLIEQVLFTSPGERVNRPTFGSGLWQLVFQPTSEPLALAVQATVQASLHQWLGQLITVEDVAVSSQDAALEVTVTYRVPGGQDVRVEQFRRSA